MKAAVIGGGLSGLVCARGLADRGLSVTVFEKSRGVGGRMATRRTPEGLRFDHGAQYFTVRDERFKEQVDRWLASGVVGEWRGRICSLLRGRVEMKGEGTERYVGVPGMNALCKNLAVGLDIRFKTRVEAVLVEDDANRLTADDGSELGGFDWVVVSTPAPQAADLLKALPDLEDVIRQVPMQACLAAMLAFDESLELPYDGAFVQESGLSWIARNNSKPERSSPPETWVVHAGPDWSEQFVEQSPEQFLVGLEALFWEATGTRHRVPCYATGHRWRFAIPPEPLTQACLVDESRRIGVCGDWCAGPRVEGAFLSGLSLLEEILSSG